MNKSLMDVFQNHRICAIIRGVKSQDIVNVADALITGGVHLIEVTFDQSSEINSEDSIRAIEILGKKFNNNLIVGAGTVMSEEQAVLSVETGAKFILAPNIDQAVIKKAKELDVIVIPGAMTPSEISFAYKLGADIVKVFPAGYLGSAYIKSIRGPLNHIPLMAVGSVDLDNIEQLYRSGCHYFGIGGNLVNPTWVQNGQFEKITEVAKAYVNLLSKIEG